jgi:hypothetical protein
MIERKAPFLIAMMGEVLAMVGLLTPPAASATSATTTSADLATTMSPTSQQLTNFGPPVHIFFTAVVTNHGPKAASPGRGDRARFGHFKCSVLRGAQRDVQHIGGDI